MGAMLGYVGAVWLVAVVGGYLPFAGILSLQKLHYTVDVKLPSLQHLLNGFVSNGNYCSISST